MTVVVSAPAMAQNDANPLLQEWNTPYGTPPFSKIENRHYAPAVRQAIKMAETNVKAIKKSKEAPSFANTIEALERSSETLERITGVLFNLDECNTNDELSAIVMELTPELTRYENSVWMDEGLFERVKTVYDKREGLTAEERMLTEKTYKAFVRNGVNLDKKAKKEYGQASEELARLSVQFNKNVLADNNAFALNVTDGAMLSGIPANVLATAKEEAKKRGQQGWTLTLDYPTYGPVMQYADNRSLREQMWRAYNSRSNHGDANDNNEVIRKIVALRYRMAQLLGYKDYLDYKLDNTMAHDAKVLNDFMVQLINASYPAARRDLDSVARWADDHQIYYPLQRWDFSYLAEKLKQERYSFDAEALRPYFQLERVRQGIFDLYGKLYGLSFKEVNNIDKYHPDVSTFEVWDNKKFMGVLYLDMFPRPSKRGGAWMTEFRGQNKYDGRETRPLIQVVTNFSKPTADAPS
ncbi:MAG: M3 family metallopeptidase, partial [Bacteroidales bacterium]|nr:M3 family metallopeptidase [Bacteroidales bacterium]